MLVYIIQYLSQGPMSIISIYTSIYLSLSTHSPYPRLYWQVSLYKLGLAIGLCSWKLDPFWLSQMCIPTLILQASSNLCYSLSVLPDFYQDQSALFIIFMLIKFRNAYEIFSKENERFRLLLASLDFRVNSSNKTCTLKIWVYYFNTVCKQCAF